MIIMKKISLVFEFLRHCSYICNWKIFMPSLAQQITEIFIERLKLKLWNKKTLRHVR